MGCSSHVHQRSTRGHPHLYKIQPNEPVVGHERSSRALFTKTRKTAAAKETQEIEVEEEEEAMDPNQRAQRAHQFHPARAPITDLFNLYLGVLSSHLKPSPILSQSKTLIALSFSLSCREILARNPKMLSEKARK